MDETKTVLYRDHLANGAKMTPFAGFLLPIQYQSIIAEHAATRKAATVFDTCHMGEFRIHRGDALSDLENLLSCAVGTMPIGRCRYGLICNPSGGVIDDQILYRLDENDFFMVVNAATRETDYSWIASHLSKNTRIEDRSEQTAKVDLQGPGSPKIMQALMEDEIGEMKYYGFKHNRYKGRPVLTSRTGYTGEIGFEIYCDNDLASPFWNDCLELGAKPAGLGARDTLRLEMCFPLYGHELSSDRNASESGLLSSIATDKTFIGSSVVLDESVRAFSLAAMVLDGRRAARSHDVVIDEAGNQAGVITSGSFSPSLGRGVALGYLLARYHQTGTSVRIKTERHELKATVSDMPLYKAATGRKTISAFL
jgi:aminomethyltransferase